TGCRRTWWTSARTREAEQARLGGPRRLHPGDCHKGPARQACGNGDAGGRGDHPGRRHGSGQRVSGPRGAALPGGAVHRQKDQPAWWPGGKAVERARGQSSGLQYPATPSGHSGTGGRGDANSNLSSLSEQCNQVPAQQELTEGRNRRLEEAGAFKAPTKHALPVPRGPTFEPSKGRGLPL
ncbi:hypothetical protein AK812_SmicGene37082, partial [Symbiodinium microadriaticum]